jgi:hypothetical protein
MESDWAAEHLQVIRTLMERAAVYRRALAPIMLFNGILGSLAAVLGLVLKIDTPRGFILFWGGVAVVAIGGSLGLVRRQALSAAEPFWSPPTRRVTQAMLPAVVAGLILSAVVVAKLSWAAPDFGREIALLWLPLCWIVLYGCGFHGAGFFMPRGMRLFGWAFVLGGCAGVALGVPTGMTREVWAHLLMGFFFGLLHLAYGIYLYFTEQRKNVA